MIQAVVDTDVIIRLLTGDDVGKQRAAKSLFKKVEKGDLKLVAPDTVIADAVYVLSSPRLYGVPRVKVRDMLITLVALPGMLIANKKDLLRALELYGSTNLDFGDCHIVATMQQLGTSTLYSFDQDFDKIGGVKRVEPTAS